MQQAGGQGGGVEGPGLLQAGRGGRLAVRVGRVRVGLVGDVVGAVVGGEVGVVVVLVLPPPGGAVVGVVLAGQALTTTTLTPDGRAGT